MAALQQDHNMAARAATNNVLKGATVTGIDSYHYYLHHPARPDDSILLSREDATVYLIIGDIVDVTVENSYADNFGFPRVFVKM